MLNNEVISNNLLTRILNFLIKNNRFRLDKQLGVVNENFLIRINHAAERIPIDRSILIVISEVFRRNSRISQAL